MEVFKWEDKYKIGSKFIDEQHKQLFALGNRVFESTFENSKKTLWAFYKYTREHFKLEEDFMKKHGYPAWESHRELHFELITSLSEITENGIDNKYKFEEFQVFIYTWLTQHILVEDIKYMDCVNE